MANQRAHAPCSPPFRCLNDNDDEVRDRATFYLSLLEKDLALSKTFITAGAWRAPCLRRPRPPARLLF